MRQLAQFPIYLLNLWLAYTKQVGVNGCIVN